MRRGLRMAREQRAADTPQQCVALTKKGLRCERMGKLKVSW